MDARRTPGLVTPLGARGAVFISLHHDAAGGRAGLGHAFTGLSENWYHGEGSGAPAPGAYPDSAPHRPATLVTPAVERRSADLASAPGVHVRPHPHAPLRRPRHLRRGRVARRQPRG